MVDINADLADRARPGRFDDPDMLQVGAPHAEGYPALSIEQARTHIGLWALIAAPLVLAPDVRALPEELRAIVADPDIIAIDQDPLVQQARLVDHGPYWQVWRKPVTDGSAALGLFNRADHAQQVTIVCSDLAGVAAHISARDLRSGRAWRTRGTVTAMIPAHGLGLLRVTTEAA